MNLMKDTTIRVSSADSAKRAAISMRSGDTVRVWSKVQEKGKTRLQAFEGIVLARKHGTEAGATFTVRKVSDGVAVERIFPLYSPSIDKIEIVKRSKSRRSKLYYIREKAAKEIKRKMKVIGGAPEQSEEPAETPLVETEAETKKTTDEKEKEK